MARFPSFGTGRTHLLTVVPKGVQHNPVADEEVGIALIETVTTAHTGSIQTDRTVPLETQVRTAPRTEVLASGIIIVSYTPKIAGE